jgi:hypothetical protein
MMNPLQIKDIFLKPNDFHPAEPVEPYPIPRGPESPELFVASFNFDDFRSFWSTERVAFQWEYRSEGGRRDFLNQIGTTLLPVHTTKHDGRPGTPRTWDWSFRFRCRRHRPPKDLRIRRESIGTGCQVYIRMKKAVNEDRVQVEYQWRHNHDISAKAKALLPVGNNELSWTRFKVAEGMDWKGVKHQLQPSEEVRRRLELDQVEPPPATNISYEHFRKAVYRKEAVQYRKSNDVIKSVQLWVAQIEQEGGKAIFEDPIQGSNTGNYIIAWSSSLQRQVIKVIC